jgi:hypothetical protein
MLLLLVIKPTPVNLKRAFQLSERMDFDATMLKAILVLKGNSAIAGGDRLKSTRPLRP